MILVAFRRVNAGRFPARSATFNSAVFTAFAPTQTSVSRTQRQFSHCSPLNMKQQLYATGWGIIKDAGGSVELHDLPKVLDKIKALGYTGLEIPVAYAMQYGSNKFMALFQEKGMQWIAQIFSGGVAPQPGTMNLTSEFGIEHPKDSEETHDVERHKAVWTAQVLEAVKLRPILRSITTHTGKDYFTPEEADDMLR